MQKCLKCNEPFEKRQIQRAIFSLRLFDHNSIQCSHCGEVHVVNFQTRIVYVLLTILVMIATRNFGYLISTSLILPSIIIFFIAMFYFGPYFTRYERK